VSRVRAERSSAARLGLRVDSLEQAIAHLQAHGVSAGSIREVENGRLASFEDPDGNELVLWQYA
jgi:predicted enzyme related to lactoylglutathione lyase